MLKAVKFFLILLLIFILIAGLFRHLICRFLISELFTRAIGLNLLIEELNLDVLKSSLSMRAVTLFNPAAFQNKVLASAKDIFIEYDLWSCLKGRLHLRRVKADITEINIIRNEDGNSNISVFTKKRSQSNLPIVGAGLAPTEKKKKDIGGKRHKFAIDRLELSLGKVTFTDNRTAFAEPKVTVIMTQGPFVLTDVNELDYIVRSVSAKAAFGPQLDNLLRLFPPKELLKNTTESIKTNIETILNNEAP